MSPKEASSDLGLMAPGSPGIRELKFLEMLLEPLYLVGLPALRVLAKTKDKDREI